MTDSINIRNYADKIFFSEINHDMFCEHRLPHHGMMMVRSGRLVIETEEERVEAHAGQYIFWHRNCKATMKKCSEGNTPFSSIAICFEEKMLRDFFSEKLQNKRLPSKTLPIYSPAVPLPHDVKIDSLFASLMPYADLRIEPDQETIAMVMRVAVKCLLNIDQRMYPTLFDFHETWKINLLSPL